MSAGPTWRVAVVDDSPEDRAEVRRLLLHGSGHRYQFCEGETGADAVRLARAPGGPPDCLVLDFHLPDADALEVLPGLTGPDGLTVCPVVVTGHADPDNGRAALRLGAQDSLGKGWVTAESLTRAVEHAVERLALQRRLAAAERRFRAVFDQQSQYALLLAPTGEVRDASAAALNGISGDAVLGRPVWDAPWWQDRPGDAARVRAAVARAAAGGSDRFETPFQHRTAGLRQVDMVVRPLFDAAGAVDGVLAEGRDITDQRRAEADRRDAEQRLQHVLDSVQIGTWEFDVPTGRSTHRSAWHDRIFGYDDPPAEWGLDVFFARHVRPDDRGRAERAFAAALAPDGTFEYECPVVRADGSPAWVWSKGRVAERGPAGEPLRVAGVILDVTRLKRMEEQAAQSESFYRQTLESIPGMVFTTTPDGACDYLNRQWEQFTGRPLADLMGDRWVALLHPDDRGPTLAAWRAAVEGRGAYDLEYRVLRRGAGYEWFKVRGRAIRDAAGAVVRWVGTALNVDGLKRAEQALRVSDERLRLALTATRMLVWELDPATGAVQLSGDPADVFGLPGLATVENNREGLELLHPDDRERHRALVYRTIAECGSYTAQFRMTRGGPGGEVWMEERASAVGDGPGRTARLLGVTTNVSERRHLEEAARARAAELARANRMLRQKNAENEAFVYSVSHDLRSPLVNLQGFSRELGRAADDLRALVAGLPPDARAAGLAVLDGPVAQSVTFIRAAVARLGTIIDSLLRLSRAGRVVYRRGPVDVAAVVRRVVDSLRGTAAEKGAEVDVGPLPPAAGDEAAVEQVFANLLANALNYLAPGRPGRVRVAAAPSAGDDADAGLLTYAVRDNGLGISEAGRRKVFQPFQRLHPNAAPGEGVGLALVQRVVDRLGGRIWFESEAGVGTTFYVALPALEGPAAPAAHTGGT